MNKIRIVLSKCRGLTGTSNIYVRIVLVFLLSQTVKKWGRIRSDRKTRLMRFTCFEAANSPNWTLICRFLETRSKLFRTSGRVRASLTFFPIPLSCHYQSFWKVLRWRQISFLGLWNVLGTHNLVQQQIIDIFTKKLYVFQQQFFYSNFNKSQTILFFV